MNDELATFDSLPLSQEVKRAISELGYLTPTPVQLAVFGPASEGKSLVVQARTGTGKTAAFGLPLVDALLRRSQQAVQALVLTPTRELALQVAAEIGRLGQHRGVRIAAIYGGAAMQPQIDELASAPHIVVGTPGRVLDHLRRGTFDASHVRTFVLDEADEMLSMGFARELSAIVEHLPKERQGLFFSATIPPDIERMAREKLRDPEFITLSSDQAGALTIDHFVYLVREKKGQALLKVIEVENPESAIVFCNTKDETERVAEVLRQGGFEADWLNGDLEQKERERVMKKTREGKLRFLVATDVAARGIDISHLTHVINYDWPESAENYVHRTGRTGRAGRTGTAISLVAPRDVGNVYLVRLTYKIKPIEKQLPTSGELRTRAEQDVVDGFSAAYAEQPIDDAAMAIAKRLLTHDAAPQIVAHLVRALLGDVDQGKTRAAEARRAKAPTPVPQERPREERKEPTSAVYVAPVVEVDRAPAAAVQSVDDEECVPTVRREPSPPARRERRRRSPEALPHIGFTEEPAAPTEGQNVPGAAQDVDGSAVDATSRSADGAGTPVDADRARLYVNVGRRDGLKLDDLTEFFAGTGIAALDAPQIRDRMTYVEVAKDLAPRAIEALSGKQVGGRTVVAELARPLHRARP